jgi:hypothetical protein
MLKYINKGSDRIVAYIATGDTNKITNFIDRRYKSTAKYI